LGAAIAVVRKIVDTPDEDPFSGVKDAASELKSIMELAEEQYNTTKQEAPPIATLEKCVPSLIKVLHLISNLLTSRNSMSM
jgi:hypothetical protein